MPSDKTILIIDDDRNLRETLALIFRRAGYCVISAADVERAFLSLRSHTCDLVIFDFNNPGSLLTDTVSEIHNTHPAMPIVILTGNMPVDLIKLSEEKQVLGYLEKPIDPIKILSYIAEVIQPSRN
jgi:DNA-binding NtrC family response regulator